MSFLLDLVRPSPGSDRVPARASIAATYNYEPPKCYFCNQTQPWSTPSSSNAQDWVCEECGSRNVYDTSGEIVSSLPEMYDETKNADNFRRRGRPITPPLRPSSPYSKLSTRPLTPSTATPTSPLDSSYVSSPVFCSVCEVNQLLHINAKASIPAEADQDPTVQSRITAFYPLVCNECEQRATDIIKTRNYMVNAENWRGLLRKASSSQAGKDTDGKTPRIRQSSGGSRHWSDTRGNTGEGLSHILLKSGRVQMTSKTPSIQGRDWDEVVWRVRGVLCVFGLAWTWWHYLDDAVLTANAAPASSTMPNPTLSPHAVFTLFSILWMAWNPLWARLRHKKFARMADTNHGGKKDAEMLVIHGRGLLLRNALITYSIRVLFVLCRGRWEGWLFTFVLWLSETMLLTQTLKTISIRDLTPVPLMHDYQQHDEEADIHKEIVGGTPPEFGQLSSPQVPEVLNTVEEFSTSETTPIFSQWSMPQEDGPEPMDWEPLAPTPQALLEPTTSIRSTWVDGIRTTAGNDRLRLFAQTGYMTAGLGRALMVFAAVALPEREVVVSDLSAVPPPTLSSNSLVVTIVMLEAVLGLGLLVKVAAPPESPLKSRLRNIACISQLVHGCFVFLTWRLPPIGNIFRLLGIAFARIGLGWNVGLLCAALFWMITDGVCWWVAG